MKSRLCLQSRGSAVSARIVRRFHASIARVLDDHAGVAGGFGIGGQFLDVVAELGEALDDGGIEAALDLEGGRGLTPGAPEQPARRLDRIRYTHAFAIARKNLRLELRLAVAAHGPVSHDAAVVEGGERRDQRVERLAAGLERIARLRVERE